MQGLPPSRSSHNLLFPPEEYHWLTAKHLLLPVPGRALLGDDFTDPRHSLDEHHLFIFSKPSDDLA